MVTVVLIDTNAEFQEAVVQLGGTMYIARLEYLNYVRDDLYTINLAYLAPMNTCLWCI